MLRMYLMGSILFYVSKILGVPTMGLDYLATWPIGFKGICCPMAKYPVELDQLI